MTTLSTIGYEGANLASFIETLHRAGVRQIIDIRDVPASRRPGFSKNVLAHALGDEGIKYVHLKPLGDPKPGREAAREGRYEDFKKIYTEHLALEPGQEALGTAVSIAKSIPSALLCYERDFKHCHRSLVAQAMNGLSEFQIRHLGVQKTIRVAGGDERGNSVTAGVVALA